LSVVYPLESMLTLLHHPFCPRSRFIRLVLANMDSTPVWSTNGCGTAARPSWSSNPAGTTPVLIDEGHPPVPGSAVIAEYLDETRGHAMGERRLLPPTWTPRRGAPLTGWFNDKLFAEVTGPL